STLMNKGLEVIEAHWLFGVPLEQIEVVIHPESIIHSMVAYRDGSVLAQLGSPDMRTPIAVALAWPERVTTSVDRLNLAELGKLTFQEAPGPERFPCLHLAYRALKKGGTAPAILNAANEVAVAAFLEERIGYVDIARMIKYVMGAITASDIDRIETVFRADSDARESAESWIASHRKEK
ncbi:MAG: 1-deoxy-D-xylulose-5-phosphate reductoisomerase, partial [Magnetococcales bacterium]|nr:1-deoxy-D-xylulose-5-phosphate reductoisomerase [Magnetococcales bacterium]